jgi:hypothetical protein
MQPYVALVKEAYTLVRLNSITFLGFWTLSIVRILIVTRKKKNKHDVSETGSGSVTGPVTEVSSF